MSFSSILSLSNAKKAGIVALAAYLAQSVTANQSTWIRGGATVAAIMVALPFASSF